MKRENKDDEIFSADKPKNIPWFFVPLILGIVALIILFKWFD